MIVVLTALEVEYQAVRDHLTNVAERRHRAGTRFEIGRVENHPETRIALAATGLGNLSAATLTERAVAEFSPAAMLFAGVAGGRKTWLRLGDVVVATSVYAYHGGRSEDADFRVRPRSWEISHEVGQAARQLARARKWQDMLPPAGEPAEVHFAPIAAGDVVLDSLSSAHAQVLEQSYNDAAAVEMEGAGFAQAGHLNRDVPIGLVRGISDFANGTKVCTDNGGWQAVAARNAGAFAVALAVMLDDRTSPDDDTPIDDTPAMPRIHNTNVVRDNARVGQQNGINFGTFRGMGS